MKKIHIKLISIELLILLMIGFNTFISNILTSTNIYYLLIWTITFLVLICLVGFEKSKHSYKIDVLQIIFIYNLVYLIATYILGLFFGFVKSPYNLSFFKILQNIIPILIIIILQELIRYLIIRKGKENKLVIFLLVLLFILFDITLGIKSYSINNPLDIFKLIGLLIIPSIGTNLLITYIVFKSGYKPAILYRVIFDLTIYIIPLFPDLGIYLESVLNIVFPIILFLKLNDFFVTRKPSTIGVSKIKKFIFWAPSVTCLIMLVILVSGLFKVYAMAIGSISMFPNINKGDAVIIEKLTTDQFNALEIGNIIAYEHDEKIIIHRIVAIETKFNKHIYHTKGDNNGSVDKYDIEQNQVKGIVRFRIPYIGYPSVWLSELFS